MCGHLGGGGAAQYLFQLVEGEAMFHFQMIFKEGEKGPVLAEEPHQSAHDVLKLGWL